MDLLESSDVVGLKYLHLGFSPCSLERAELGSQTWCCWDRCPQNPSVWWALIDPLAMPGTERVMGLDGAYPTGSSSLAELCLCAGVALAQALPFLGYMEESVSSLPVQLLSPAMKSFYKEQMGHTKT